MQSIDGKTICQIGIVVRDLTKSRAAWADLLGCEPPPIIETQDRSRTGVEHRGHPTDARAKLVLFNLGQVTIELIQPVGEPSTWNDHLAEHGESVHHLAFHVDAIESKRSALEQRQFPLVQHGRFPGGGYAYFEARKKLGCDVELLETDH
ncbi:MAG TPA: VOC family protein [Verrucomicrobiae bacterium]|nr:VOC family protein [Verrucomicrobiae bacterium]